MYTIKQTNEGILNDQLTSLISKTKMDEYAVMDENERVYNISKQAAQATQQPTNQRNQKNSGIEIVNKIKEINTRIFGGAISTVTEKRKADEHTKLIKDMGFPKAKQPYRSIELEDNEQKFIDEVFFGNPFIRFKEFTKIKRKGSTATVSAQNTEENEADPINKMDTINTTSLAKAEDAKVSTGTDEQTVGIAYYDQSLHHMSKSVGDFIDKIGASKHIDLLACLRNVRKNNDKNTIDTIMEVLNYEKENGDLASVKKHIISSICRYLKKLNPSDSLSAMIAKLL